MKSGFDVITEDFIAQLDAVAQIVDELKGREEKIQAASSNSSVMLIVAIFGAFIEEVDFEFNQGRVEQLKRTSRNMNEKRIKEIFQRNGFDNICKDICNYSKVQRYFGVDSGNIAYNLFKNKLDEIVNRRNIIAHSLYSFHYVKGGVILHEIKMFRVFALELGSYLQSRPQ